MIKYSRLYREMSGIPMMCPWIFDWTASESVVDFFANQIISEGLAERASTILWQDELWCPCTREDIWCGKAERMGDNYWKCDYKHKTDLPFHMDSSHCLIDTPMYFTVEDLERE